MPFWDSDFPDLKTRGGNKKQTHTHRDTHTPWSPPPPAAAGPRATGRFWRSSSRRRPAEWRPPADPRPGPRRLGDLVRRRDACFWFLFWRWLCLVCSSCCCLILLVGFLLFKRLFVCSCWWGFWCRLFFEGGGLFCALFSVDVGRGSKKSHFLAVKWIWMSSTKPQ